jgi:hypothetical protein
MAGSLAEGEVLPFHCCQYQRGLRLENPPALDSYSYNFTTEWIVLSGIYVFEMQNQTNSPHELLIKDSWVGPTDLLDIWSENVCVSVVARNSKYRFICYIFYHSVSSNVLRLEQYKTLAAIFISVLMVD